MINNKYYWCSQLNKKMLHVQHVTQLQDIIETNNSIKIELKLIVYKTIHKHVQENNIH